jgi:hypothetical protein
MESIKAQWGEKRESVSIGDSFEFCYRRQKKKQSWKGYKVKREWDVIYVQGLSGGRLVRKAMRREIR